MFVLPVEKVHRIRTGEEDADAVNPGACRYLIRWGIPVPKRLAPVQILQRRRCRSCS